MSCINPYYDYHFDDNGILTRTACNITFLLMIYERFAHVTFMPTLFFPPQRAFEVAQIRRQLEAARNKKTETRCLFNEKTFFGVIKLIAPTSSINLITFQS